MGLEHLLYRDTNWLREALRAIPAVREIDAPRRSCGLCGGDLMAGALVVASGRVGIAHELCPRLIGVPRRRASGGWRGGYVDAFQAGTGAAARYRAADTWVRRLHLPDPELLLVLVRANALVPAVITEPRTQRAMRVAFARCQPYSNLVRAAADLRVTYACLLVEATGER